MFSTTRNIDSCLYSVPRVPTTRSLSAAATDPLPVPPADGTPPVYSEKISGLVKDISNLTLSEVAQLNDLLKVRSIALPLCQHVFLTC